MMRNYTFNDVVDIMTNRLASNVEKAKFLSKFIDSENCKAHNAAIEECLEEFGELLTNNYKVEDPEIIIRLRDKIQSLKREAGE